MPKGTRVFDEPNDSLDASAIVSQNTQVLRYFSNYTGYLYSIINIKSAGVTCVDK